MLHKLTIGVELEFFAVYPNGIWYDPAAQGHPDLRPNSSDQAAQAIADALTQANLPVEREAEFHIYANKEKDFSKWRIGSDEHRLTDEEAACLPEGYCFEPIELVSRKLRFYADDWVSEIGKVLSAVDGLANERVGFVVNAQCGFHVHVGLDGMEWPLHILKYLLQVVTAFEWCFDSIHTVPRIRHPEHTNSYMTPSCFFLRREQMKKVHNPLRRPEKVKDWLMQIDDADSAEELCKLFHNHHESFYTSGHNSAYNFDNLVSKPIGKSDPTGTIEFRQHAGTLSFTDICCWVRVVCQLVLWMERCPWPGPAVHLSGLIHSRDIDIDVIFNCIRLDAVTWNHYSRRNSTRWDEARRLGQERLSHGHGMLHTLVMALEQTKYAESNYGTVMCTINEKFRTGGYGECDANFSNVFRRQGIFGTDEQQLQEAEEQRRQEAKDDRMRRDIRMKIEAKNSEMENAGEKRSKLGVCTRATRTRTDGTGIADGDADVDFEDTEEDDNGDEDMAEDDIGHATQKEHRDAEEDDAEENDDDDDDDAEEDDADEDDDNAEENNTDEDDAEEEGGTDEEDNEKDEEDSDSDYNDSNGEADSLAEAIDEMEIGNNGEDEEESDGEYDGSNDETESLAEAIEEMDID